MEQTLTDYLVRVREDLTRLKKVRDYLETNAETEEQCSVTWRTIEAFNSILTVCSSQNSPETAALDTLLDSFYYLAKNNNDNTVWDDFGFELGIICVKILSAIERCDIFEVLFCKLLSIIGIICEYNGNIWKTIARQILNVLINKKISLDNLETILKLYICILRLINNDALSEFSSQNFHLLKTLSLLIQKIGDFEIQSGITQIIYLHLSKGTQLMSDIFEKKQFIDFKNDCRLFLNTLNKSRKGCDRKVYSICCHVLYLGGCLVEPPLGRNFIWVDANKDTKRVSIECWDADSEADRFIYVPFSEVLNIQCEKEKTEENLCLTIKTKNQESVCLMTENEDGVHEFVQFLETETRCGKRKKKTSKTVDTLFIDRNGKELQNVITSSKRPSLDRVLPDVLPLFGNPNQNVQNDQQLSPSSFVESLNKHIGLDSPELRQKFEDSIETIEFLQKSTSGKSHKLFRNSNEIFNISKDEEKKENEPPEKEIKAYGKKPKAQNSQDYFRGSSILKKKPNLPKLKRSRKKNEKKKEMKEKNEPKPSLLDPNGYAYRIWCKPTISERGNFWLRKLDSLKKSKNSDSVFDFSDESDLIFEKNKKKRVIHSKRKCRRRKNAKQTSTKEVEKASPVKENLKLPTPPKQDSEYESLSPIEDEEPENKKRERSDEESSTARGLIKKKAKISLPKTLLLSIKRRFEKSEEKDRRYTDEIIRTVNKATNHLFNHLQRKDGEEFILYLKTAEEISEVFQTELEDLHLRTKRIQRVVFYFKVGCSVGDFCEFIDCNFNKVRESFERLRKEKNSRKAIERVCDRLKNLISMEVEKSFKAEWVLKRERLLKCATLLGRT